MSLTILDVPYEQKDEAKRLGARWHPEEKKWYVPEGVKTDKFKQWIPEPQPSPPALLIPPLYLIKSVEPCWKCGKGARVYTLGASGIIDGDDGEILDDFVTVSMITSLPEGLRELLKLSCPNYYMDYSKTTKSSYMMNHCSCGAKLGDFFMHNEPGGAFFPTSLSACSHIHVTRIKTGSNTRVECLYAYAPSNPIKSLLRMPE